MEDEDSILGLAPASLPVHAEGAEENLPMGTYAGAAGAAGAAAAPTAAGGSGWSFEEALRAAEGGESDKEDNASGGDAESGDGSDAADEEEGEDTVLFRDGGAASGEAGAEEGDMDDAALRGIADKKAAKRLGKALYKRWKKLHKSSKKDKHKSSSSGKHKEKSKSGKEDKKKAKKKSSKESTRKRSGKTAAAATADADIYLNSTDLNGGGEDGDDYGLVPAASLSAAAAAIEARLHKAAVREAKMRVDQTAKKAAQRKTSAAELVEIAKELVGAMAKARKMDDDILSGRNTTPGAFPLNRVALKPIVQARCRQAYMVGPLVDGGILQELSYWLYDVDRAEPAPYGLRTTALDILVTLPMEGSIAASEDLTAFMGVSREHLIKTDLGRALNALRRYNDETIDNRAKCMQLLTAFSRVISGATDNDQSEESRNKAVWKCQRDPTVASPFEVLETCSEAFQKSFMKPDPRDPTSYNGVLPWRPPPATITNVSGKLADYIEQENPRSRR